MFTTSVILLVLLAITQTAPSTFLKPCSISNVSEEVRCGTYAVWEDCDKKAGRQIPLNIIVLPALASTPTPDPLVVLVGGRDRPLPKVQRAMPNALQAFARNVT